MKNISIFCGAHEGKNPKYAEAAKIVAEIIARKGINIVFGGGNVGLMKIISDTDRDASQIFEGQLIYHEEAYEYSGFALTPEMKYYFGWDAPFGPYFSLFVKHVAYHESFEDKAENGEYNNYNMNITAFGRGLGAGYQFRIKELVVVDLGIGYMIQDKKSEKQGFGEDGFTPMKDEKKDGVRIAVSLGTAF